MNRLENTHRYDDIIDLPHPVSKKHPQMPSEDRAAQFSPFAALTGYERAIREKEMQHEERMMLGKQETAIKEIFTYKVYARGGHQQGNL